MGTNIAIGNLVGKHNTGTQKINFPFSNSLVDYWNFGGKSNFDKDRTTVTGLLGNVLTAYNFGWSLGSGYGLFKENYLIYHKAQNVFVTDDHSVTIMNFIPANTFAVFRYDTDHIKATKVRVTGLTATDQLTYEYLPSDGGSRAVFPIPEDGEYDLPESIQSSSGIPRYNVGFAVRNALTKNVTIEQIPLYEGAIVTDGVDDYLKLDKTGYKVGTIIIKYIPIPTVDVWQYVLETKTERIALGYYGITAIENDSYGTNFDNVRNIEGYKVCKFNDGNIKNISTSLFIGSNAYIKEQISMALYSIAIYDRALSDQEVQEVINFMNKDNKS